MSFVVIVMGLLFGLVVATVIVILKNIQTGNSAADDVVREAFSCARYRPMFRLLDESDRQFINSGVPGRAELRRFRAERRSLFRLYLRELGVDHSLIVRAMRKLLVESSIDRPDLAKALYRCQFIFAVTMVSIEFKLLLHAIGIGTVDVRSLFSAVEGLQLQLQDMIFVRAVSQ